LAVPDGVDPYVVYGDYQVGLAGVDQLAGVNVISINSVTLVDPYASVVDNPNNTTTDTNGTTNTNSTTNGTTNTTDTNTTTNGTTTNSIIIISRIYLASGVSVS